MKKGKFLTFIIKGRNNSISGIVLDYSDEWILIRRCFDYSLDGYTIFVNSRSVSWSAGPYEKLAGLILRKKKYDYRKDVRIPILNMETVLAFVTKKYKILQLDTKDGDASDVVKFMGMKETLYLFYELTAMAKWRYKLKLPRKEITVISFNNEYLNSLKLLL